MTDLVAAFRAQADQDAAFESAMRLVGKTADALAELERELAEMTADRDRHRAMAEHLTRGKG